MRKLPITVVTWFYDDQPGFLDFRYRIESLSRHYAVTLVLRNSRFLSEFEGLDLTTLVISTAKTGKGPLVSYLWRAAGRIRTMPEAPVILLGAQLAMGRFLLPRYRVAIYWNEHPTHTFSAKNPHSLSGLLNQSLVRLAFAAAHRADLVMPIGEAHRDDLLAHGIQPKRMQMVYMGVDDRFIEPASPLRKSGDHLTVVYTGTVARERGRDVILEGLASALASGAQWRLSIVGASPDQLSYCTQRASELGISAQVSVVGRVPGHAIPELLRQADCGICIWEDRVWWRFNPPTKLFEYLVAGLPVLGSRIRTHTTYLRDWDNGLIFDYDASAFADALLQLWRRRDALPKMSVIAASGAKCYLWSRIEPQFLKAIASFHSNTNAVQSHEG
jgi:glycosyltransferase involved in cell wall biosynthesis